MHIEALEQQSSSEEDKKTINVVEGSENKELINLALESTEVVNIKPFICIRCGITLKSEKSLKRHEDRNSCSKKRIRNKIKSDIEKQETGGSKNGKFECKICEQTFKYKSGLINHESKHKGPGGFLCRLCGQNFISIKLKEKHKETVHKVWRCFICKIRFKVETDYLVHIGTLHDGRNRENVVCSDCGKQFKSKPELVAHVTSKCGTIKRFKCDICGDWLMTAGALHNHRLRHKKKYVHMCRFCAKTFLTAGQMIVHERIHTGDKVFVCKVCNKGFCHRQSLITHSTLHTGIKPFICEGCTKSFSCIGNLLKHRKTHADTCGLLPLTNHSVKNPETRMKIYANIPDGIKVSQNKKKAKLLKCLEQSKQSVTNTENILNENHNSGINECRLSELLKENSDTECVENGKSKENQDATNKEQENKNESQETNEYDEFETTEYKEIEVPHIVEVKVECCNNDIFEEYSSEIEDKYSVENQTTGDISEDSMDLYTRQSKQKIEKSRNDDRSQDSVNLYMRKLKNKEKKSRNKQIKDENVSSDDRKKGENVSCKICNKVFSRAGWLFKHEKEHMSKEKQKVQPPYKCVCCLKRFETKDECSKHKHAEHSAELGCSICNKWYANRDSKKGHDNYFHRGVPRKSYTYVCNKCGKTFQLKGALKFHEESDCGNRGEKMFKCEVCDKAFSSIYTRKAHMYLHENEKRQLCKFCGKSFARKGQLKVHERSHTGDKPFECQFCPKAFAYRESLITHNSLHTGIKPYLCVTCGKRFSCIGNLLKHRRTHASTCGQTTVVKDTDSGDVLMQVGEIVKPSVKNLNMIGVRLKKKKNDENDTNNAITIKIEEQ